MYTNIINKNIFFLVSLSFVYFIPCENLLKKNIIICLNKTLSTDKWFIRCKFSYIKLLLCKRTKKK